MAMSMGSGGREAADDLRGAVASLLSSDEGVEDRVRAMLNALPHMVWSTRPDGYHDFYNDGWYLFTGVPYGSTDGDGWAGLFHADDQEQAWARWRHSLETGDPYEVEYRLRRHDGEWRWMLGRARPIRRHDGVIERWIGTCTDIHDLKEAEAGLALVAGELTHRIKNMFAVASAMLTLGARRRGTEAREFAAATAARLDALARMQDLIRPGATAAELVHGRSSLQGLIRALAAPHGGGRASAVSVNGSDIELSGNRSTAVVLVLHEMFTNALKYGALSMHDGSVSITTDIDGDRLVLCWSEQGGPEIEAPPERQGFGSSLTERIVRQQLGGTLTLDWKPGGLSAIISVPLARLSD